MTSLYFVEEWVDNGYNYDTYTVAVWLDKQKALDYAGDYQLEHLNKITVEERQEGVQRYIGTVIYQRQHYDHTQALFSMVGSWYFGRRVGELTEQNIVAISVAVASPLITEDVDFNKLYQLYKQECCYDDED